MSINVRRRFLVFASGLGVARRAFGQTGGADPAYYVAPIPALTGLQMEPLHPGGKSFELSTPIPVFWVSTSGDWVCGPSFGQSFSSAAVSIQLLSLNTGEQRTYRRLFWSIGHLAFSRDLRYLAADGYRADSAGNEPSQSIYVADLGAPERRVSHVEYLPRMACSGLAFDPETLHLYYSVKDRVMRYELATGLKTQIAVGSSPSVSPNGMHLAIVRDDKLILREVHGVSELTIGAVFPAGAKWSPDGQWLVYVRPATEASRMVGANGELVVFELATRNTRTICRVYALDGNYAWVVYRPAKG